MYESKNKNFIFLLIAEFLSATGSRYDPHPPHPNTAATQNTYSSNSSPGIRQSKPDVCGEFDSSAVAL